MTQERPVVGRFAPSPSGRMNLGNAFSALIAWLAVRSAGGEMVLRQEDLDPQRCKREYADQIEEDYRWLGLDWDRGAVRAAMPITRAIGTTSTPKPWKHCAKITSSTPASAPETNSMPPPPLTPLMARPCTLVPAGT